MTPIVNQHIPGVLTLRAPTEPAVPLVFDSPHSGCVYPADFRPSVPMAALRQAEDMFIDELYDGAPAMGAALLVAHFPRLYIDPNRAETDLDPAWLDGAWPGPTLNPGAKAALGQGLIWTRYPPGLPVYDGKVPAVEAFSRVEAYHRPYHRALRAMVNATHARFGAVYHVDCHSMPAVAGNMSSDPPGTRRPDFVLGTRDGTTCGPEMVARVKDYLAGRGYDVRVDEWYKGVEIVRSCGDPAHRRHSLQIEINRRLYMDEQRLEKLAGFAAFKAVIDGLMGDLAAFAGAA